VKAFKVTRPDGTDFRTGTVQYSVGAVVEVADPDPPEDGLCRRGLHVSLRALDACHCSAQIDDAKSRRPWRFFEVEVAEADVIRATVVVGRVCACWCRD
jgi:hypothetical protein